MTCREKSAVKPETCAEEQLSQTTRERPLAAQEVPGRPSLRWAAQAWPVADRAPHRGTLRHAHLAQ